MSASFDSARQGEVDIPRLIGVLLAFILPLPLILFGLNWPEAGLYGFGYCIVAVLVGYMLFKPIRWYVTSPAAPASRTSIRYVTWTLGIEPPLPGVFRIRPLNEFEASAYLATPSLRGWGPMFEDVGEVIGHRFVSFTLTEHAPEEVVSGDVILVFHFIVPAGENPLLPSTLKTAVVIAVEYQVIHTDDR